MTDTSRPDHDLRAAKTRLKNEQRALTLRRFMANRLAVCGLGLTVVICLLAFLGPLLTPHGPLDINPIDRLQPPSAEHWMGTDNFGRDIYVRVLHGTRASLLIGFSVALLSSLIGVAIGLYSAYFKLLDHVLMRITDGLMAFPAILLAISVIAVFGPTTRNVILTLVVVYTPLIARVVRSNALVVKEQPYIESLRALGSSRTRIIWRHIFPNTVSSLIVQASFVFAVAIITEAMLSFLGVGIPAPHPSLGNILYDGKNVITSAWWMTVFPGAMIIGVVLGQNILGDGLRDFLDPHTNKAVSKR
ncbi:ABC transporter permease [Roseivivax sediminis]|uniref:Peptide/nickel transport system permease protein n=1 Tax=Roseivivax sediminis TaxID=936889 RepID=A0A1I1VAE6_9RHOB|nr:ABC transporter permease [Roseivivax sediminis]SFD79869.1 peptide/nickel transport system permease protein [Roseivivax sediminis]